MREVARFAFGIYTIEVAAGDDAVWAIVRRDGLGGLALRIAHCWGGPYAVSRKRRSKGQLLCLEVQSVIGTQIVTLSGTTDGLARLRVTSTITPRAPLLVPFVPRDLYPIDANDDPLATEGHVEAAQRGLNSGVLYFQLQRPAFGNILYFQNFTTMNPYYRTTRTSPDGAVGGAWPELGYLLPTPTQSARPLVNPLPAGETFTLSDAILVFRQDLPPHERESARQFLQMLGEAYKTIELPPIEFRDWPGRAMCTLRELDEAPDATISHYGNRYLHPYTASEYPDSMVQLAVLAAVHDWGCWQGEAHPLEAELARGLGRFYDPRLGVLRRYLPNVGKDKDADAVDSWYLYHPLLNLARLARGGVKYAERLLLKSIEYAIKAAHHFKYRWPIQYKVTDFAVITETATDGRGQTDVGGLYAYLMLQLYDLTGAHRYLLEARTAIDAAIGMRFNLNYQANLTAWGAAACMRLYRITNEPVYAEQSYVYLASFFHNCEIWDSQLEHAVHYKNFLGVTALQDGPYMAVYECFDSFAAFEVFLDQSGPDLDPAVRMLVAEYCRYALDRAWFFYPDALPPETVSAENRNGHVDRRLSFPLEDLYPDGQQAGQVGQEIYGAGAALIFATRSFHRIADAPFLLFCDHFLRGCERLGERSISIVLDGGETCSAFLSFVRKAKNPLPRPRVATAGGDMVRAQHRSDDRIDFVVPANGRIILTWER